MCGIFGAAAMGETGAPLTLSLIRDLALAAETRGTHAWGVAWIDENGRSHYFKAAGRISDSLEIFDRIGSEARAIIGHTRFATHGSPDRNENNHPHIADGGYFVHNGQIPNHEELVQRHDLLPTTECDSEVLGLLIASGPGRSTLLRRVSRAINACEATYPLAMAGLWSRPGRLVLARRGNPLVLGKGGAGNLYFGSLDPADVFGVEDGAIKASTRKKDRATNRKADRAANRKIRFVPMDSDTTILIDLTTGETTTRGLVPFVQTGRRVAGSGCSMRDRFFDRPLRYSDDPRWTRRGNGWVFNPGREEEEEIQQAEAPLDSRTAKAMEDRLFGANAQRHDEDADRPIDWIDEICREVYPRESLRIPKARRKS